MPHSIRSFILMIAILLATQLSANAAADWSAPADQKFSEKQLAAYITTALQWSTQLQQINAQVQQSTSAVEIAAATSKMDEQLNVTINKNGMQRAEYDWLSQRTLDAYNAAISLRALRKSNDQLVEQSAEILARLTQAHARLNIYEAAKKGEYRVLSDDDRAAVLRASREDQQAAADEIHQRTIAMNAAEDEARQHDADVLSAEKSALAPGAEMTGIDRANYVADKTSEAKSAGRAAVEARSRAAGSRAAIDSANQRLKADAARLEHPERPQTDDEKAAFAADNDTAIASARTEIEMATAASAALAGTQNQLTQNFKETSKSVPPENVDLLLNHINEYAKVWTALGAAPKAAN